MAVAGANGSSSGGAQGSVWVGLLGPLEVRVDGATVTLPRGSLRTLLGILTMEPGRVVRDETLIDRLWGEAPPKSVVFSLRNLVARLRAVLGAGVIERAADGYRLNTGLVHTDVQEFIALVAGANAAAHQDASHAVAQLDRALSLVRGAPLEDAVDDLDGIALVRRIEEQVRAVEEQWGALRLAIAHVGADLARYQEAVDRQPLREVRWAQLIDAFVQAGRRAEALRAAQRARECLKEIGLSLSPELLAAEKRALGTSDRLIRWTPGATLLEDQRAQSIVGRSAALAALDPLPTLSRVCAADGMGKTRFLAELAARERERGAVVLYVSARARNVGEPFLVEVAREFRAADATEATLTPAMQALLREGNLERVAVHPIVEVRDARLRVAAAELVDRVVARDEVILILDDVHLLDVDAARSIIDLLERPRRGLRVIFSVSPPSDGAPSVLDRLGRDLVVGGAVELEPLGPEEVHSLLTINGTEQVAPEIVDDVLALSGGNPSLVLEAIRQFARIGVAVRPNTRLDDIVLEDLQRRSTTEREVLAVLAILGRPVPPDLIAEVIDRPTDECTEVLSGLVSARLVEIAPPNGHTVRLALVSTLVPVVMPAGSMIRLRGRIVDALRSRPDAQQLLVEQLFEVFDGSEAAKTELSCLVLPVLRSCLDRVDYGTALRIGERYLDLVGLLTNEPQALEAQLLVAAAMLARGDVSKGKTLLDFVAERAVHTDNPTLHADALLALGPVQTGSEHSSHIADEAERALERLAPTDTTRRIQLATWAAHHRTNQGRRSDALQLIAAVSSEAAASTLPTWRSLVLLTAAHAELAVDGSPSGTRERAEELRAWAALTRDETAEAATAISDLALGFLSGTLQDVELARDAVVRASVHLPRSDLRWMPKAVDAGLAVARGEALIAERLIGEAEETGKRLNTAGAAPLAMLHRALWARLDGSYGRLAPFLEPSSDPALRRHELVALWGLACVDNEDAEGAHRAVALLTDRPTVLNRCGLIWPIVAMSLGELAWFARDAQLGNRLWDELRHWSGHGLSVLGMAYAGAADIWLGAAAAATGRKKTAVALLGSAVEQEARRGAEPWRRRAERLLDDVIGSGERLRT